MPTLFTAGYGSWPAANRLSGLIAALREANVTTLVDIRHSPCSSNLIVGHTYGPKDWHLQSQAGGLPHHLEQVGLAYRWLVELGNPQKNDPQMQILREHLASGLDLWPVNRGLKQLAELLHESAARVCVMCACEDYDHCHRRLVAEVVSYRYFDRGLGIVDLSRAGARTIESGRSED